MMKKMTIWMLALSFAALPVQAAPDRVMTLKANVDGMVCAFCAQGLLAHFRRHEAISNIHVDLTRKLVILEERQGKSISDAEVKDAITRAGFDPGDIKRVTTPFEEVRRRE